MKGSSKSSNLALYAGIAALATLAVVIVVCLQLEHSYDDDLWNIIKDAHDFTKPLTDAEIDELWKVADVDGSGTISESELRTMMIKLWEIQVEKVKKIAQESAEDCRKVATSTLFLTHDSVIGHEYLFPTIYHIAVVFRLW